MGGTRALSHVVCCCIDIPDHQTQVWEASHEMNEEVSTIQALQQDPFPMVRTLGIHLALDSHKLHYCGSGVDSVLLFSVVVVFVCRSQLYGLLTRGESLPTLEEWVVGNRSD